MAARDKGPQPGVSFALFRCSKVPDCYREGCSQGTRSLLVQNVDDSISNSKTFARNSGDGKCVRCLVENSVKEGIGISWKGIIILKDKSVDLL